MFTKNKTMKTLGIDFGTKKLGLSISDEGGRIAFPLVVLRHDKKLFAEIKMVCDKEDITTIVLGESLNFAGEPNLVMEKINTFKEQLAEITGIPVVFEKEFLTSKQARNVLDSEEMNDASAAAIILQSWLDRKNN